MSQEILIVDDEPDIRTLISGILEDEGFQTRGAANSAETFAKIDARRPDLVLLDIWLQNSEFDGLEILKRIISDHPELPILMMSGHGTIETAVQAIQFGAYDFIEKPFKADRMIVLIQRAMEAARLHLENQELRVRAGSIDALIGDSKAMREILQVVSRVALTNSRVMITGPAGSGKEVVARLIHKGSMRANGSFVVVNCATMTPDRMEIELFGTESTDGNLDHVDAGNRAKKIGTFETAHNGTLVLDEVADMPMETQGKIVRVLQEQVFQRVGGSVEVEVDVRVIATTTKNLSDEVDAGRFRRDLYYRLNVVPVVVPNLYSRKDDIPILANYFMAHACETIGQPVRTFSPELIAALQAHKWPGNVRELRNFVERMLILSPQDPTVPLAFDSAKGLVDGSAPNPHSGGDNTALMGLPLREAREIFERDYLSAQVNRFGGNISKTAEFVGMERSALHRKLKSLRIQDDT